MMARCERCGVSQADERQPDGSVRLVPIELQWIWLEGRRWRVCLGCIADLRSAGRKLKYG